MMVESSGAGVIVVESAGAHARAAIQDIVLLVASRGVRVVEVAPQSWQSWARKALGWVKERDKDDQQDAKHLLAYWHDRLASA